MKRIYTVQHTQSEQHVNKMIGSMGTWNLTELGESQAHLIGKLLADELHDEEKIIYSSDIPRAKQTAEIISKYLNAQIIYDTRLREFDLGEANGKTKAWAKENVLCPTWEKTNDWAKNIDDRVFTNAETKREVWERVSSFCDTVISSCEKNIIIVSHDGTLSILFAIWLGITAEKLVNINISGKSGGVSLLCEYADGSKAIAKLNDMSYIK